MGIHIEYSSMPPFGEWNKGQCLNPYFCLPLAMINNTQQEIKSLLQNRIKNPKKQNKKYGQALSKYTTNTYKTKYQDQNYNKEDNHLTLDYLITTCFIKNPLLYWVCFIFKTSNILLGIVKIAVPACVYCSIPSQYSFPIQFQRDINKFTSELNLNKDNMNLMLGLPKYSLQGLL